MTFESREFIERAWRCRRLAAEIGDDRANAEITKLGKEYCRAALDAGADAELLPVFDQPA